MLRGGRVMLTVWLFLALLSVGEGTICFETGPSRGMSIVAEEAGMACVTVTRSTGDPDTFGYRAVAGTATENEDFIAVPAGARPSDRPPRFQSISFQNSSLTAELCVTIESDNIACEILSQETIFIELDRRVASVCDDYGLNPLFTVQIEDSTRLPVRFTQTEVRVSEAEQTVQVVVEAITGDAFNINSADLMLVEDPNESGCLQPGSSETIQFGCNHPGSCSDLGGEQPTVVTVSPSLVGNNDISDCHRFCSLVLERAPSTQCKFAFPDGNCLSLVVEDDEDVFVSFSTTFTQVREDNGSLFLTLRSTRAVSQPFTVHLNSRLLPPGDNTATVDDFTPGPYEVTFPAGQTSQVLNIPITNDELLEADTNDFDVLIVNFTSNCSIRSRSPNEVLVQILYEDMTTIIQLYLRPVSDCPTWVETNRDAKLSEISAALSVPVQLLCNCSLSVQRRLFSCPSTTGSQTVVFLAELSYIAHPSVDMPTLLTSWLDSTPHIIVASAQLQVDSTCPVVIDSMEPESCAVAQPTDLPTVIIATVVACAIALLVVAITVAIVIAVVVCCKKQSKHRPNRTCTNKESENVYVESGSGGVAMVNMTENPSYMTTKEVLTSFTYNAEEDKADHTYEAIPY